MRARRTVLAALALAAWFAAGGAAAAAEVHVAAAANFAGPLREIVQRFEAGTGHKVRRSLGASGQFYAQIANGAPYQVFLSADAERPRRAEAAGLAVRGTRFTYATGRLVLYSRTPGLVDKKGAVLRRGGFDKLAIADPAVAPYGEAAVEALRAMGLYERLEPKLVRGSSIAQAQQFVRTGAAELGFLALSQVVYDAGGSRWLVPRSLHRPIEQQAVLLSTGADSAAAKAFLQFLEGPEARAIIRRHGYEVG